MKNRKMGIKYREYIYICVGMGLLSATFFLAWLFKQKEIPSLIPFLLMCILVFTLGYLLPKILIIIKNAITYMLWKNQGYKQSIYVILFFIFHNNKCNLTSNVYINSELFIPKEMLYKINSENINVYISIIKKVKIIEYILMGIIYIGLVLILYNLSTLPIWIIPIVGFVIDFANANIDTNLFKGELTKLKYKEVFSYFIIRQKLLDDVDTDNTIKWFIELEKNYYDDDLLILERISIWEKIIIECCNKGDDLPEESDFILQTRYLNVKWKFFVTAEIINLYKFYLIYTVLNKKENQRKVACNLLQSWMSQDVGEKVYMKFKNIYDYFIGEKNEFKKEKLYKQVLYFSDFKIEREKIMKITKKIDE